MLYLYIQKIMEIIMITTADLKKLDQLPIGSIVVKRSGRPFKSGRISNTIKGYTINEQTKLPAYIFDEDDSNIECFRCIPKTSQ